MPKMTYRGPGDAVELDGLRFEAGKAYDVTNEQLVRIRNSDPAAAVDGDLGAETELDRVKIRADQDEQREKAVDAADKEQARTEAERDRLQAEGNERVAKSAQARADRAQARTTGKRGARAAEKGGA